MTGPKGSAPAPDAVGGPWHPATTWAPLAGVALVLFVTVAFGQLIGFTSATGDLEPAPPTPAGTLASEALEFHARVGWCLSAIVLTLAMCVALVVSIQVARTALEPLGVRGRQLLLMGGLACAAVGVVVWQRETVVLPHVLQVRVDGVAAGVKQVREISKGAAVSLIFGLLLAMCAVLRPGEHSVAALAARTRQLRVLLMVSASVLVAGVLEIAFLLRWPLAHLDSEEAKALGELGSSVTAAAGGVLAMFLVAAYGLASWILMSRARTLAPDHAEPARREWFAENGLDSTLTQHLSRALVMISPWVASGPLSALLETLG